ncbi:MAG: ABC-2 family transporter protein [Fimbriimonadaceae bacterium]
MRKFRALFAIYFQETFAYRASMIIWIMTDIVTSITMPLVFLKASSLKGGAIEGFTGSAFVTYYLSNLLITMFVTSHIMWDLAMEIKEGQFTQYLMRPHSIFNTMFTRNLVWRLLRTILCFPIFLFFLYMFRGHMGSTPLNLGATFWVAVVLGHLVSFCLAWALSMIALIVQEAHSIFELYYVPMLFFSGQLFPIAMLPDWAKNLSYAFPFYYTSGFPTEILVGRVPPDRVWPLIAGQLGWIAFALLLGQILWNRGRKHYSAVGM